MRVKGRTLAETVTISEALTKVIIRAKSLSETISVSSVLSLVIELRQEH